MNDRVPKNNGRNNRIKFDLAGITNWDQFVAANAAGTLRADVLANNDGTGTDAIGTPLNKATLLKDATAAKFGLMPNALPDDALDKTGEFLRNTGERLVLTKKFGSTPLNGAVLSTPAINEAANTVYFSETASGKLILYKIDLSGAAITIAKTVEITVPGMTAFSKTRPCYYAGYLYVIYTAGTNLYIAKVNPDTLAVISTSAAQVTNSEVETIAQIVVVGGYLFTGYTYSTVLRFLRIALSNLAITQIGSYTGGSSINETLASVYGTYAYFFNCGVRPFRVHTKTFAVEQAASGLSTYSPRALIGTKLYAENSVSNKFVLYGMDFSAWPPSYATELERSYGVYSPNRSVVFDGVKKLYEVGEGRNCVIDLSNGNVTMLVTENFALGAGDLGHVFCIGDKTYFVHRNNPFGSAYFMVEAINA